jgi:hypothetical protein
LLQGVRDAAVAPRPSQKADAVTLPVVEQSAAGSVHVPVAEEHLAPVAA